MRALDLVWANQNAASFGLEGDELNRFSEYMVSDPIHREKMKDCLRDLHANRDRD